MRNPSSPSSGGTKLPQIAVGYQIGNLTVCEATSQRKNGYLVWKCRCNCGNDILLDTRCLQRGSRLDCGCLSKVRPGQRDLTGQRFGKLVCLAPTEQRCKNGSIVWNCRCDCGTECLVPGKQLTAGCRKSCGCLSHPPLKDFLSKRFGQLTVTEYAGKRNGMHRWKCRCDCGNETIVGQTLLQTGKTKSCGCLKGSAVLEALQLCDGTSVTALETSRSRRISSNKSGYTGVYLNPRSNRWIAQITFKRKTYYLGSFEKMEDAVKARQCGEKMHEDFLEWYYQQYPN